MNNSNKTESYIVLKPISERFSRIANEITDNEIKELIKSELRNQLQFADFASDLKWAVSEYLENHEEEVNSLIKNALINRL